MVFRARVNEGCVRGWAEEGDAGSGFVEQDEVRAAGLGGWDEECGGYAGAESDHPREQTRGMKVEVGDSVA